MPLSSLVVIPLDDVGAAKAALSSSFRLGNVKVKEVGANSVEVRRGSRKKLRVHGGRAIANEDFPVVAMIQFSDRVVRIEVQSDMGFGSMVGMKKKYQGICDAFAQEIADHLAPVEPQSSLEDRPSMDRFEAAVLLGIATTATRDEAHSAYLARARLLHPDRFAGGTSADIAAATAAMAQLNKAMEVFRS